MSPRNSSLSCTIVTSVFDLNILPRSDCQYKYGSNQNSSTSERRYPHEKIGPSYNKRVIQTQTKPLEQYKNGIEGKDGRFSTKIWVQTVQKTWWSEGSKKEGTRAGSSSLGRIGSFAAWSIGVTVLYYVSEVAVPDAMRGTGPLRFMLVFGWIGRQNNFAIYYVVGHEIRQSSFE